MSSYARASAHSGRKSNFGARLKTLNMQTVAVKQLDPVVHVQQTDFISRHLVRLTRVNDFWINPVAGIAHGNPHPFAAFGNANGDDAFAFTGLITVNNCVFDQRLNKQLGITQLTSSSIS